ncbi:GNAT family N-acetyltransferase [Phytoactinopolyspora limicola]|uniref:GNAT family N-acetyltransferase n=1 Tax=Phytoactinopolyspora limicola TaxID=2715536 RepID=UPI00140B3425|nr:GNAT family N-acetyltransferase [Phytoactinopolyspora limicola]
MEQDHEAAKEDIQLVVAGAQDVAAIEAAIALGNASRSTLGHMPFAAYYDATLRGCLVLARLGNRVVGYALFGLARNRVRLSHLCVEVDFRGHGIARRLVEHIRREHSDHLGILARCRHDYGLGELWISLGFSQLSEQPGRSKEGYPVVSWWLDHGHPNLFSTEPATTLVRAAIDLNVLRDFVDPTRADADETRALRADHLTDQLELVRTAALDIEINEMQGPLRAACTQHAQQFRRVNSSGQRRVSDIEDQLRQDAQIADPGYPHGPQDELDVRHVAEAAAAGLNVLTTRDQRLTTLLGPPSERLGLRIVRPVDVIIHIDELARAEAYRPAALLNTSYSERLVGSGQDGLATALADIANGERPQQLLRKLRALGMAGHDRMGVYDSNGQLVAVFSAIELGYTLEVPLLRVSNNAVGDTLARQLLFRLRERAHSARTPILRITDPHMSRHAQMAAIVDGFRTADNNDLYTFVLGTAGPADSVEYDAAGAARRAGVPEPASLRSGMPAVAAATLERTWWPVKIVDSDLANYLIPIQQRFSADLLGMPNTLIPRNDALGLAIERVYYRSPGGARPAAPARLLWYMSEGGRGVSRPASVIACSQLDTVVDGDPRELHSRFQHLGVWRQESVERASRNGRVQALRFTHTEVFLNPISRQRFRQLSLTHGSSNRAPQGPRRISTALFTALYAEGRGA